jgi:hypothetical protein
MNQTDIEARAFMQEFQGQPGMLQLMGAFNDSGAGVTLIYKNPDTNEVFEIVKPDVTEDEEREMNQHIKELLQEHARAA